jgi:transposase
MKCPIDSGSWQHICLLLQSIKGMHSRNEGCLRILIEAVGFVVRRKCQWRLLPECYDNWRAVHRRFKRWTEAKIWAYFMKHVSDPDTQEVMMDAISVRAHACSAGYKKTVKILKL